VTRATVGARGGTNRMRRAGRVDMICGMSHGNRRMWNTWSDTYQSEHGDQLDRAGAGWGVWSVPESDLGALGDLAGRRTLEIGCGAARFSAALTARGARCVGLDVSDRQLRHARATSAVVTLVQGSADRLPFADATFDVVFSDHGGASWADPVDVVAEAARVLRPGGRFAANVSSPWLLTCRDPDTDAVVPALHHAYFGRRRIGEESDAATFTLTYGEWVRTLRANGLVVEDLIELRPSAEAATTYTWYVTREWAHRWPAECLWVASKSTRSLPVAR
jgi:ubiquinone/menaquinone biosynthesis C-methylase UbiE